MSTYKILEKIYNELKVEKNRGVVADYIPELKKANINDFAIVHIGIDNDLIKFGDYNQKFTIQSISKVISLAIAMQENTVDDIRKKVGFNGIEESFNTFAKLEIQDYLPANPMINTGAITTTSLISGDKIGKIINFIKKSILEDVSYNEDVYLSEKSTGDRNKAIAYLLKNKEILGEDFEFVLDNYFKQCSIEMNTEQLGKLAFIFANGGKNIQNQKILDKDIVKKINAIMTISGMYNYSGEYAVKVGMPSKSGVGGAIIAIVPNKAIIAVYSPGLDENGNSYLSQIALEKISKALNYNIF